MKRTSWVVPKTGRLSNLILEESTLPDPSEDEVQVEVKAIGLNYADVFAIYGLYSATPKGKFIPGLEFSGIVQKIGKNVRDFSIGDPVMGATRFGGYTTHLNSKAEYISSLPNGWSFAEGAAFLVQGLTAYYALFVLGNLQEKQTVLIHSAAGGVGILANRLAKQKNAFTIGLIGDLSKKNILIDEGYDEILLRTPSFLSNLRQILDGKSLDLVLECTGGKIFEESWDQLSPQGRMITYGSANFTPKSIKDWLALPIRYLCRPKIDPLKMISENKSLMAFNLIWLWEKKNELKKHRDELMKCNLAPQRIQKLYHFYDIHNALIDFQSGKTVGKLIVLTDGNDSSLKSS